MKTFKMTKQIFVVEFIPVFFMVEIRRDSTTIQLLNVRL